MQLPAAITPAPKRRWFAYSLRTMFVVMTVVGAWLAWQFNVIRERRAFLQAVDDCGGGYVLQDLPRTQHQFPKETAVPFWRLWMGDRIAIRIVWLEEAMPGQSQRARELFPEAKYIEP